MRRLQRTMCYWLIAWLTASASAQRTTLIDAGGDWRYLADSADPGTAWRVGGFDDSGWSTGAAPLGFGQANLASVIGRDPARITSYFRAEFELSAEVLARLARAVIELRRDDGAVVYLNGAEIRRDNLPAGEITSLTVASSVVAGRDEDSYFESAHPPVLLVAGTNTLAVEVHNSAAGSSDLAFDLKLIGDETFGFLGSSRPPCAIDFESVEFPLPGGTGIRRYLDPNYAGIEYSYWTSGGANGLRTSDEFLGGGPLGSSALAFVGGASRLRTERIDVRNYTDVRVTFDLRTEGELSDPANLLEAMVEITGQFDQPRPVPWLSLGSFPGQLQETISFFAETASLRYQVPTFPQLPIAEWTAAEFDDSAWLPGNLAVGYERSSAETYTALLGSDLEAGMFNVNASVNVRIPFSAAAEDLAKVRALFLDVRYDDGFVAWLNGTEIARMNAPAVLDWNSQATATHADLEALSYERIPIATGAGLLRVGENILAVRGLNSPPSSSDFLIQPQLVASLEEVTAEGSLGFYLGEFKTIQSELGLIPDDTVSLVFDLAGNQGGSAANAYYIDNLVVTGTPIAPDSFTTAVALDPGLAGIDLVADPDPEGDGLPVLLEYAFGGSFTGFDEPALLLPQVSFDGLGFMRVRFRILEGFRLGDAERGYDVADLRYTPQLSYDLANWGDGRGVPPFEQDGEIRANGDGTATVSLRSRRRLETERGRAFFRLLVEVARPPQVVLGPAP